MCDDLVYNCAIHFKLLENSMRDVIPMGIELLDVQLQYLQKGLCCCLGFLGKGKQLAACHRAMGCGSAGSVWVLGGRPVPSWAALPS